MLCMVESGEHERDHAPEDVGVIAACFEDEDRGFGVLGEFAGQDAACCSCTHNYFYFEARQWPGITQLSEDELTIVVSI